MSRIQHITTLGYAANLSIEEVETGAAEAYRAMADEYSHGTLFNHPLKYYSDSNYPPDSIVEKDLAHHFALDMHLLKMRGLKPLLEVKDVKAEVLSVFDTPSSRPRGLFKTLNKVFFLTKLFLGLGEVSLDIVVKITSMERQSMLPLPSEVEEVKEEGKIEGKGLDNEVQWEQKFSPQENFIVLRSKAPAGAGGGEIPVYWFMKSMIKDDAVFNKYTHAHKIERPSWSPDVTICSFNRIQI